jgi:hypothetical protein
MKPALLAVLPLTLLAGFQTPARPLPAGGGVIAGHVIDALTLGRFCSGAEKPLVFVSTIRTFDLSPTKQTPRPTVYFGLESRRRALH